MRIAPNRSALDACPALAAIAAFSLCLIAARASSQDEESESPQRPPIDPRVVEVRFTDDSRLKVMLADERIEMETTHGKLSIPAEDVRAIDFAQRLTDEQKQEVDRWIADLGSDDSTVRNAAADALLDHPAQACAALLRAAREGSEAVVERSEALLKKLREEYSPEELSPRELDMVQTEEAKIAGRIVAPALKLRTTQFGLLDLKLADARSLRSLALADPQEEGDDPDPKGVLPDPGNLKAYESQIGKVFLFKVTGGGGGSLWGTGTYTTDSHLASASVHSGVLKTGETGIVQVKIIASPPSFAGSMQNGLMSSGYGPYGGAYEISKPKGRRRGK